MRSNMKVNFSNSDYDKSRVAKQRDHSAAGHLYHHDIHSAGAALDACSLIYHISLIDRLTPLRIL